MKFLWTEHGLQGYLPEDPKQEVIMFIPWESAERIAIDIIKEVAHYDQALVSRRVLSKMPKKEL